MELFFFFLPDVDASDVYVCAWAWALGCFHSLIRTQTFQRALISSVDSCAEIKSVPFRWRNQFWQSLDEGAEKRCSECGTSCAWGWKTKDQHNTTLRASLSGAFLQTPSIAFRHLPPNCARFSYAIEEALFNSAKLSTDAVSALRKVEAT